MAVLDFDAPKGRRRVDDEGLPVTGLPRVFPEAPEPRPRPSPPERVGGASPTSTAPSRDEARRRLEASSRGIPVTETDIDDVLRVNLGETYDSRFGEFAQQFERRATSTGHRPFDSQDTSAPAQAGNRAADVRIGRTPLPSWYPGASSGAGAAPPRTSRVSTGPFGAGSYDDPAYGLAEDFALRRFEDRVIPPRGSGAGLYEDYARRFASSLEGGPFSEQEEQVLRTRMFDQLEQRKQAEQRQRREELAARGIPETSGIFLSEMNRVRDKWDRLAAQGETELASSAIGERQRRLTQALSVLGGLAGYEDSRFREALNLSQVPVLLQQRSFDNLLRAAAPGGDPADVVGSLLRVLGLETERDAYNTAGRSAALGNLMTLIGMLFPTGR